METSSPIIRILRSIKTDDGSKSLLDVIVNYLYGIEEMSVAEISALLRISISSTYKALRKE